MGGMGRTGTLQAGISVAMAVADCGDVDLRSMAGGVVALATGNGGLYDIHVRLGDTWLPFYAGDDHLACQLALLPSRAYELPQGLYGCGLIRLVGPAGTIDVSTKS